MLISQCPTPQILRSRTFVITIVLIFQSYPEVDTLRNLVSKIRYGSGYQDEVLKKNYVDLFGPFQMDFLQLMYYIREKKQTSENQKIKSHDNLINLFTFITVFNLGYFPLKPHPPVLS